MKKQIIIILLIIIHLSSWSQNKIPTDGPCTEAMLLKVKGKWIKSYDLGETNNPKYKDQQKEAYNRLDEIHNMVLKIYPQPTALDAVWHRAIGISYFGSKRKYGNDENSKSFNYSNLAHFSKFYYKCGFFAYYCGNGNFMWPGHTNETGTWITITANEINGFAGRGDDTWTINGLPVRMRNPVLKTNKDGYDLQHPEPGTNTRYVLIHRKGVLPYRPVTRKQYLDKCLAYTAALHDKMIDGIKQMPVRNPEEQEKEKKATLTQYEKDFGKNTTQYKSAADYYLSVYQTDQQRRDEELKTAIKIKEDELKKFTDELEKTTSEGLLDASALVWGMYLSDPVFSYDPERSYMLVTENPAYIRKDLPKFVPQVFVVWWTWNNWAPQKDIGKMIEDNFPFDKIQAMIDK